jgi:hypothetical protein
MLVLKNGELTERWWHKAADPRRIAELPRLKMNSVSDLRVCGYCVLLIRPARDRGRLSLMEEMMKRRNRYCVPRISLAIVLLVAALVAPLQAIAETDNTPFHWKLYEDEIHGFRIEYLGELVEYANSEICLRLPLEEATVHILVDSEPSVLLSGTFGGRYYFEEAPAAPALANRVLSQEAVLNGVLFKKDYWIVYGGAGGWDTVINCYTEWKHCYYIISLHHEFMAGIPGIEVGARRGVTGEQLANEALSRMLDGENEYVSMFNSILSTFALGM